VRWVLVEAAHKAAARPPFARFFAQCAARRGPKIATVAVARKLLARSFHILKQTQTSSQPAEKAPRRARSQPDMRLQDGRGSD
jgi:hypothetical protein